MSLPELSSVSIVLLSFNRKNTLEKSLPSLIALSEQTRCELIVVDNASTDGSKQMIGDLLSDVRSAHFIASDTNLGVSQGRNAGWRLATRKYILSIDDDITFSSQDVAAMLALAEGAENIGIVSPDIIDSVTGRTINSLAREGEQTAFSFYEACFMIPRSVVDRVGCLDARLNTGGEGLDYSLRLRKAGYLIRRSASARVIHTDRIRSSDEAPDRRRKWLWSFCYVYWKNMNALPASMKSARICLAHLRTGLPLFGLSFAAGLPPIAFAGARAGRSARRQELKPRQQSRK